VNAAKRPPSLAGPEPVSQPSHGFRAIGVAVSKVGAPIIAKRGGGLVVRLKADWPAIVGTDWAAVSWPTALARDGCLKLRAAPSAALELQHRAPLLIERVNVFFGHVAVTRLILVQGLLPVPAAASGRPPSPIAPREAEALDEQLTDIADPELRSALARLGRAVIDGRR
jgi:hypothetical protein